MGVELEFELRLVLATNEESVEVRIAEVNIDEVSLAELVVRASPGSGVLDARTGI